MGAGLVDIEAAWESPPELAAFPKKKSKRSLVACNQDFNLNPYTSFTKITPENSLLHCFGNEPSLTYLWKLG